MIDRKKRFSQYINNYINKANEIKKEKIDPSWNHMLKAVDIVKKFIKQNNRKIIGGIAINEAIKLKSPKDVIYTKDDFPDYDFYSPTPIKDIITICNNLYDAGFKYVQVKEALHPNTYKIHVELYEKEVADVSYVWSYLYNKIPTFTNDGFVYVHPKFLIIDIYKIFNNPILAWFKLEKSYQRATLLEELYIIPKSDISSNLLKEKFIFYDISKKNIKIQHTILNEFIINNKNGLLVGIHAFNILMNYSGNKKINKSNKQNKSRSRSRSRSRNRSRSSNFEKWSNKYIDEISIVTSKFSTYVNELRNFLNTIVDKNTKIEEIEYYPFLELYGNSIQFLINKEPIIRVYYLDYCIPFHIFNSYPIGSYYLILYMLYTRKFRFNIENKMENEKMIKQIINIMYYIKEKFYSEKNLIGNEDTLFQELVVDCLGDKILTSFKKKTLKKKKGKTFVYSPEKMKVDPTKIIRSLAYIFPNSSGNPKKIKILK
jgi:hypothetical protein